MDRRQEQSGMSGDQNERTNDMERRDQQTTSESGQLGNAQTDRDKLADREIGGTGALTDDTPDLTTSGPIGGSQSMGGGMSSGGSMGGGAMSGPMGSQSSAGSMTDRGEMSGDASGTRGATSEDDSAPQR